MSDPSIPRNEASLRTDWAREVRARLSPLRLSPTRESEIVEELSQHLDDRWRELMAGGATPEEATHQTRAEFSGADVLAKYMAPLRQAHAPASITPGAATGQWLTDVWQDLRYAARKSSKQPGFAATAVVTLALGIGASAAMFSVVYGVLLKPLPFDEPERLVSVMHGAPAINVAVWNQGPATFFTYRDNQRAFEGIGAWESNEVSITGRGDPEHVEVLSVSDTTLPLLRVQPILGRLFNATDDAPGSPLRAVLTYAYWQRRFGGVNNAVGQSLDIDGTPAEIIGVLPSSFKFLRSDPALLLPMQLDRATATGIEFDFQALARLKPGVTLSQANADVARMIPLLLPAFRVLHLQPFVRPLAADVIGDVGHILWILLAAVGVVLIIACGNVANLFLIRAEGRQQELAMRAALGASRGRLARVLLSESILLALVGGALGLLLAQATIGLLRRIAPVELPRVDEIGLYLPVLLFTLATSVLSGAVFGLIAVLKFGSPSATALKEGGRSASDAPGRHRTRNVLVVTQVALALMLLNVSGLMIRTFVAMRQVQPGFTRPEDVQTFRLAIPEGLISDPQQAARTYQSIAERLAQVPGVASVGLSSSITMDGEDNGNPIQVEDVPVAEGTLPPLRRFKSVAPGYFETMGNRLVAGRSMTWTEMFEQRPVIVISETLAREYWKEPSRALGKRVRSSSRNPWREIVGVTGDERDDGLNHPATPIVYWPMLSDSYGWRTMAYAVRSTRVGTPGFLRELQRAVWTVNPNLPLAAVQTLDAIQARSMAQTSFAMVMLAIAASVALLLGVVGIYGVIAYIATQRTREIGTRMALGAQTGDVRRLFLRQGFGLTLTGVALGIGVSMVVSRVMSALLFGVGPMDPVTYAAVAAGLTAVALIATYLPARRASRIDPIIALRSGT
jgi:putative ABC transport system permease protein